MMVMKITEINLSKFLVKIIILSLLFTVSSKSEVRESRALVVASQEAVLSSELAARINSISVKEMERFKKGDLLIQFDCSLYEAQKDVVRANENSALIKLKSDEQMLQMRSIGKYELELSISEYEKAKSELRIAELNVERCEIRAPFDGAVEEVVVNAFESIQPQVELMKIIKTDVLELEMVVSSEWVSWLTIGHPITVYIDEIQEEFNASISGIGANVDAVSQTIQLKGTITNASSALLPGMSGRVVF